MFGLSSESQPLVLRSMKRN